MLYFNDDAHPEKAIFKKLHQEQSHLSFSFLVDEVRPRKPREVLNVPSSQAERQKFEHEPNGPFQGHH